MRSLTARRPVRPIRDPAPSKWTYKYQRLMLTPLFRSFVRVGTPLVLIAVIAGTWFSKEENRQLMSQSIADAKAQIQHRPEFMVQDMKVNGANHGLTTQIVAALPMEFPVSSFDLDLVAMRETVVALDTVKDAEIRVGEGGALLVDVTPRKPVAVWRAGTTLKLLDGEGIFSGTIPARADRLDLPLIAGDGAEEHIAEALEIFRSTGPLTPRVRGLVRMGERRWDLVLDRNQRILLPETDAFAALDRVIVLGQTHDLLERDVAAVDMRNSTRPIVRMSAEAANALRRVSEIGADN
ncbi:cell division protein FtsQ [Cognatiyoonia koreensis]|uniref:Cell division protein FtsQ n=1 Tax=Cognatiyoonia koreensis TaxID=364200 RepID=A0A1I0Q2J7_9RHOB|nr:cell division protein FtsQ/DivIB [Cognatiyoonia koreensis]SEW21001.1 cell division protein FtsQ [Cognatiyoonia koreensis]